MNPYEVGIGGFVTTFLYIIIAAFIWRIVSAKLVNSDNARLHNLGAAMGSTL